MDVLVICTCLALSVFWIVFVWILAQSCTDLSRKGYKIIITAPTDLSQVEELLLQARKGQQILLITDLLDDESCCSMYRLSPQTPNLHPTTWENKDLVLQPLLHLQKDPSCSILEEVIKE